jgi:hypothetical protein
MLPLRGAPLLERAGLPRTLARAAGSVADLGLAGWHAMNARRGERAPGRIERVQRFTADFDDVTERCMSFGEFWSPHNADFLNWRYLDHPVESYVALALVEEGRPTAYAVVCLERDKATLTEFAVEQAPFHRARKLLSGVVEVARAAGSASVNFFGPPSWRHWDLFARCGFVPYRTRNHLEVFGKRFEPEVLEVRNWQLTPGDRDFR